MVHSYVKDQALQNINRNQPVTIDAHECKWVITVPAIWSDAGKAFMRTAARSAGLTEIENSVKLVLALEPEAACIASQGDGMSLQCGDRFMILDCGGGTVDITMHSTKSVSPLQLDEIAPPSGGPWGSTKVDGQFHRFLYDLMQMWRKPDEFVKTPHYVELMETWEQLKLNFNPSEDRDSPLQMSEVLEFVNDMKMKDMVDTYNAINGTELRCRGKSTVLYPKDEILKFFDAIVIKITDHVRDLLRQHKVKYIFLVGGFGECRYLEEKVKAQFQQPGCTVITPMRPSLAVLRGAVMYGFEATTFASRKARFTYGVDTSKLLSKCSAEEAQGEQWTASDGKCYIQKIFSRLVRSGQTIQCDEKVTRHGYSAITERQRWVTFNVHSYTRDGTPTFVNAPGCTKIGKVSVPVLSTEEDIDVSLKFGVTELVVEAYNTTTAMRVDCKLDYGFVSV